MERRVRKANFNDEEVRVLLREVSAEHAVLSLNDTTAVTQTAKTAIWKRVAQKVSVCGVATRAAQEVREKWRALKGLVLKRQQQVNDGGTPDKPIPYEDIILSIIEGNGSNFYGDDDQDASLSMTAAMTTDDDGITITFPQQSASEGSGSWGGAASHTESAPRSRAEKRKAYAQACQAGRQDSVLEEYLQSAIEKNKAFTRLCEIKNKKAMLEIKLLKRQLGESQDGDHD